MGGNISTTLTDDDYLLFVQQSNKLAITTTELTRGVVVSYLNVVRSRRLIVCPKCNCEYSSVLGGCPSCRKKEMEEIK